MGWRMIYKPIFTADNAAAVPTIAQKFRIQVGEDSKILAGLAAGIIFYGNPAFDLVKMEVWTDKGGSPGRLLATSITEYRKADLLTLGGAGNSGYSQLGFAFPRIPLKAGMYYHAVVRFTGYSGVEGSNAGWRQSYPDPQYRTGLRIESVDAGKFPFELSVNTLEAK